MPNGVVSLDIVSPACALPLVWCGTIGQRDSLPRAKCKGRGVYKIRIPLSLTYNYNFMLEMMLCPCSLLELRDMESVEWGGEAWS